MGFQNNENCNQGFRYDGDDIGNDSGFRGDDCGRDDRGLEFFHGLVMKAIHEFEEADRLSDEAACYVAKGIGLQGAAGKERAEGMRLLGQAYQWLQRYGRRYDCNFENPRCQRLLQQIVRLGEEQNRLDQYGLRQITDGLAAWRKAEELGKMEQGVIQRYIQCIHARRDCRCRCEEDDIWNCD